MALEGDSPKLDSIRHAATVTPRPSIATKTKQEVANGQSGPS